jgi:hypothetical protein
VPEHKRIGFANDSVENGRTALSSASPTTNVFDVIAEDVIFANGFASFVRDGQCAGF